MVVMAASWRSRQRPSPLRGGRGGGLCPFVVVTAEVFYTSTQKQRKKSLHMRLPPFSSQEPAWGLRLFTALAPPGDFFGEIIEKKKKKAEKKPPPLAVGGGHVAVFAAPPWRSRRSFADTAGGLSWRSFLVFQFGGENAITSNLHWSLVCSSSSFWHPAFGVRLPTRSWALGKGPIRSV